MIVVIRPPSGFISNDSRSRETNIPSVEHVETFFVRLCTSRSTFPRTRAKQTRNFPRIVPHHITKRFDVIPWEGAYACLPVFSYRDAKWPRRLGVSRSEKSRHASRSFQLARRELAHNRGPLVRKKRKIITRSHKQHRRNTGAITFTSDNAQQTGCEFPRELSCGSHGEFIDFLRTETQGGWVFYSARHNRPTGPVRGNGA